MGALLWSGAGEASNCCSIREEYISETSGSNQTMVYKSRSRSESESDERLSSPLPLSGAADMLQLTSVPHPMESRDGRDGNESDAIRAEKSVSEIDADADGGMEWGRAKGKRKEGSHSGEQQQ